MCTLIVAHNLFPNYPVVVAANRDELLDRPSEKPQFRNGPIVRLSPKDLQRGGTWIGVNERGVFAGLTNRIDIKSERGRVSRGDLVERALLKTSALEAFGDIAALDGKNFNGFHLVIADAKQCFLLRGDGNQITSSEENGLVIATNHGIGRRSNEKDVARRVTRVLSEWSRVGWPAPDELKPLLNIHDEWRHGTCIHDPKNNYGTK